MAERVVNGYKRLFEVRLLHHYWLDDGNKVFDSLDENIRNERLLRYDVRQFLSIEPTKTTERLLRGLKCVFKPTALGMVVAIPEDVLITDNPTFEFLIKIENLDFFNYTALTFRPQKVYELNSQADNTIYRYKENVFAFTNTKGTSKELFNPPQPEPPDPNDPNSPPPSPPNKREIKFLSRSILDYDSIVTYHIESLIKTSDAKLWQALRDQPVSNLTYPYWKVFAEVDHQPVYAHQGDIPVLSFPTGISGPPYRGIELKSDVPDHVFALIQIEKLTDNDPMGLMNGAIYRSPVYEIRFKNRSTKWRYQNKTNPKQPATELGTFPLTFFGNASAPVQKQKPSVGFVTAEMNGSQITALVSEIFI